MKKYRVIFHLTKAVDYEVEADSEEQAEDIASARFTDDYRDSDMEVDVADIEELK